MIRQWVVIVTLCGCLQFHIIQHGHNLNCRYLSELLHNTLIINFDGITNRKEFQCRAMVAQFERISPLKSPSHAYTTRPFEQFPIAQQCH